MSHPEYPDTYECIHCHEQVHGTAHLTGQQRGKQRCDGTAYGLPYGYNAHPIGTPCDNPWTACIGSVRPDPNLEGADR